MGQTRAFNDGNSELLARLQEKGTVINLPPTGRPHSARSERTMRALEPVSEKNQKHQRENVLVNWECPEHP